MCVYWTYEVTIFRFKGFGRFEVVANENVFVYCMASQLAALTCRYGAIFDAL